MRSNASSAGTMNEEWTHNGKGVVINEQRAGIGKSIVINGELSGGEDLTIEGTVEGKIELRDHVLTVGSNGRIKAEVAAKSFVVFGQVVGNLTATEKVDIKETGSVEGDITAPRLAIADGSHFRGSVEMPRVDKPREAQAAWNRDLSRGSSLNNDLVRV